MVNTGRRALNRATRHRNLLEAAGAVLAEEGIANLTMQSVADRVECAVGTIYTYFPSKSALLAALQSSAIRVLGDSYDDAAGSWDAALADAAPRPAALARLVALGDLFCAWPELHPREFDFLQMLISSREEIIATDDALAVVPQVLTLMSEMRVLIDAGVDAGVLRLDADRPGDDNLSRTLRWLAGLDGAVLVSTAGALAADLDPYAFDRATLGRRLTLDLLTAWGAPTDTLAEAVTLVDHMAADALLLPISSPSSGTPGGAP